MRRKKFYCPCPNEARTHDLPISLLYFFIIVTVGRCNQLSHVYLQVALVSGDASEGSEKMLQQVKVAARGLIAGHRRELLVVNHDVVESMSSEPTILLSCSTHVSTHHVSAHSPTFVLFFNYSSSYGPMAEAR